MSLEYLGYLRATTNNLFLMRGTILWHVGKPTLFATSFESDMTIIVLGEYYVFLGTTIEKIRPWIPAFLTHILRFRREEGVC